jgi:hypothetical protein
MRCPHRSVLPTGTGGVSQRTRRGDPIRDPRATTQQQLCLRELSSSRELPQSKNWAVPGFGVQKGQKPKTSDILDISDIAFCKTVTYCTVIGNKLQWCRFLSCLPPITYILLYVLSKRIHSPIHCTANSSTDSTLCT